MDQEHEETCVLKMYPHFSLATFLDFSLKFGNESERLPCNQEERELFCEIFSVPFFFSKFDRETPW